MKTHSSLFKQSAIGVFWMSSSQVLSQIIHTIIRLILAGLLAPADFGLMAMAMLVINFTNWFLDMGLGTALVQRKELTEAHKSTAFWANLLMGLAVFACLILTSPLVAHFFQTETLIPVTVCLSFGILFIAPRSTLENLLMREGKFQTIASRQIWAIACGGATGLTLAWFGYGIWALVAGSLIDDLTDTLFLFWRSSWRPRLLFERQAFSELWQYSKPLISARLFNYFNRNLDTILIGRFLGATQLGYYNLGYQFVLLPLFYITRPLNKVLFTTFSKVQDDHERLRKGYLQSIELLAIITCPIMTVIALTAPTILPVILGSKWQPAASLIPYFCVVGFIQSLQMIMPSVFQATGHTKLVLRWTLTTLVVNALAFGVGLRSGVWGVAVAYMVATLLVAPFLQTMLLNVLQLDWFTLGQALFKPSAITCIMLIAWFTFDWVFRLIHVRSSTLTTVSLQSTFAIGIYFLVSWGWHSELRGLFTKLLTSNKPKHVHP